MSQGEPNGQVLTVDVPSAHAGYPWGTPPGGLSVAGATGRTWR